MKVLVVGDVHSKWETLNELVTAQNPDIVLQCGDFGYFPRLICKGDRLYDPNGKVSENVPILWCDGNHEDHEVLAALRESGGEGRRAYEVAESVYWQDRGSTIMLPDGRVVLFMGGADSIDKDNREQGRDWFPGELVTRADIAALPDVEVDIVISHTCPNSFKLPTNFPEKECDPSRQFLDEVFQRYSPTHWFFGHWHEHMLGKAGECSWECLDMLSSVHDSGCFAWLKG